MDTDSRSDQPSEDAPTDRDAPPEERAPGDENPIGGDATTEDQLEADNPAEEATVAALDPDNSPA
jgi:hypothetical protein